MALDFKIDSVTFDASRGGQQEQTRRVVFDRRVDRAEAAITGFDVQFTDRDRAFKRQKIDLSSSIDPRDNRAVIVKVLYLLRDNSGNVDDRFEGRVDFLVVANYPF